MEPLHLEDSVWEYKQTLRVLLNCTTASSWQLNKCWQTLWAKLQKVLDAFEHFVGLAGNHIAIRHIGLFAVPLTALGQFVAIGIGKPVTQIE